MSADPSIVRADVVTMRSRAAVCRALLGGTPAMREARTAYLPQEPAESDKAYESRLAKTSLFPAFRDSLDAMVGKPLGEPIVTDQVPGEIEAHLENVDLTGRDLDSFARSVFADGISDGITWVVVDAPKTTAGMTLAQERAAGVRPYWVHVPLSRVLGWRSALVAGRHVLTQFRTAETIEVEDGAFGSKVVEQIRVWNRDASGVQLEVWRKNADSSAWAIDLDVSGPVSIKEIPVACLAPGRTGFMSALPPLEDLAWLNVTHWQSSSDQRHVLHTARVTMLAADEDVRTDKDTDIILGPNRLIVGLKGLKHVEHSGAAIESGRTDLNDLKEEMRTVAGKVLTRQAGGDKSATEAGIEARDGGSKLRQWTWTFQDFLEECLRLHAAWMGQTAGGSVVVSTDWDDLLDPQTFATVLQARQAGLISQDTFLHAAQRAGALDGSVEDEKARLDADGMSSLGVMEPLATPTKKKTVTVRKNADGSTSADIEG